MDSLIDEEKNQRPIETFIGASMVYRIPLEISRPGFVLRWKFKAEPKVQCVSNLIVTINSLSYNYIACVFVFYILLQSIAFAIVGFKNIDEEYDDKDDADNVIKVIIETTMYKSEDAFVEASAKIGLPGIYCVYFDNSFSRFLAKKITCYLSLQSDV